MTTLTLAERIAWLHSDEGPEGKLSHDKWAKRLKELGAPDTLSRGTILGWEGKTKDGAQREPQERYVAALAAFSGMPPAAFSRRGAEVLVKETAVPRLQRLEARAAGARAVLLGVLAALAEHDIRVQLDPEASGFLATQESLDRAAGS